MVDRAGPPKGSFADSKHAVHLSEDAMRRRVGGTDPARLPSANGPVDPLAGKPRDACKIVYRDLPVISTITEWSVDMMRAAIVSHMMGIFYESGQLADAILGDDRVQATLGSRISGLFGREVIIKPASEKAVKGSMAAQECADAWAEAWPRFATAAAMTEMGAYSILMGEQPAQLLWDTTQPVWQPVQRPWHMRHTYYNWDIRQLVAIGQGTVEPVIPGNGKWILHAPYGDYRGWIRGAIRPIAEPWLIRAWARRDWARYSEKHGIPIVKAYAPAVSEEGQRDAFEAALSQLGTESTILLNRGVDGTNGYDVEFAEPVDDSWQSFPGLIDRCDMSIVLAVLFQNLTTEVKGGSFAATTAHMDIRQGGIQYDNVAWAWTIRQQVARVFAWLNFGNPALAPHTYWDVTPRDELAANADQFQKFGAAVQALATGGITFEDPEEVREFAERALGLKKLPRLKIGAPVAAQKASSGDDRGRHDLGSDA